MMEHGFSSPQWSGLVEHLTSQGYALGEVAGRGGMGVVLKARDMHLGRDVAIKAINTNLIGEERAINRFNKEMQTMAQLRHPAIVQVYQGQVAPGGVPYFAMEYCPGPTLADALDRTTQRYSVAQTVKILSPIASALDYLHNPDDPGRAGGSLTEPIVHRDIKPANIILQPRGAMLTDFGVSHVADNPRVTQEGHFVGTPRYMAPEMFKPGEDLLAPEPTPASDNYAFALVALEMVARQQLANTMSDVAWRGDRPLDYLERVPASEVFTRALDNDPAKRFPTAGAFLEALEQSRLSTAPRTDPEPDEASDQAPDQAADTPATRRRGWKKPVVATVTVAALAAAGGLYVFGGEQPWAAPEAPIAAAFPQLVAEHQGGTGWAGTTCTAGEPEGSQRAKVSCTGPGVSFVVADYGSGGQRAAAVPADGLEEFTSARCAIRSGQLPGASDNAYAVVLEAPRDRYAILVAGPDAQRDRLNLPVC